MPTSFHIDIDIKSALTNWRDSEFNGLFFHNSGKAMTTVEAKAMLVDRLSQGQKKIRNNCCDNFDNKIGCLGHEC